MNIRLNFNKVKLLEANLLIVYGIRNKLNKIIYISTGNINNLINFLSISLFLLKYEIAHIAKPINWHKNKGAKVIQNVASLKALIKLKLYINILFFFNTIKRYLSFLFLFFIFSHNNNKFKMKSLHIASLLFLLVSIFLIVLGAVTLSVKNSIITEKHTSNTLIIIGSIIFFLTLVVNILLKL